MGRYEPTFGRPDPPEAGRAADGAALRLVPPSLDRLGDYADALAAGWSPNTERDASAESLAALRADPRGYLRDLADERGSLVRLDGGRVTARLPFRLFWLWDGAFCGAINLRYVPNREDLPDDISGHIGYAVVPWKRRLGYATQALGMMLPLARAAGLGRVLITCDEDNAGSRRVIEKNGGVYAGTAPNPYALGKVKRLYWVAT